MTVTSLREQWEADRKARQQRGAEHRQTEPSGLPSHHRSYQKQPHCTAAQLQAFSSDLSDVAAEEHSEKRQAIAAVQAYVADLQSFTQTTLSEHQRDRVERRERQDQRLAKYVDELEASVGDYLNSITHKRRLASERARVQPQGQGERQTAPEDYVQALRNDYIVHKQKMQAFRINLRRSVWGDLGH